MHQPCRVEVVIDSPSHGPLTYAYDVPSRTWYYIAFGASAACIDGSKVEHWRGNGDMRKLLGTACEVPGFYRYSLPFPWLLDVLAKPQTIQSVSTNDAGVTTLVLVAPAGNIALVGGTSGFADVTTHVEISESGGVLRWGDVKDGVVAWKEPRKIGEAAQGVDVLALNEDWTLRSAKVSSPRRITQAEFEAKAREFLMAKSDHEYAKVKGNMPLEVVRKNDMPDTSEILGNYPVRERWTSTWGPAMVAAGVLIGVVGGVLAWRRRRGN